MRMSGGFCFSALQRAENSSTGADRCGLASLSIVSVLFSEPKIPQRGCCTTQRKTSAVSVLFSEPKIPQCRFFDLYRTWSHVSVLFSEPKIPQFHAASRIVACTICFSALQRAENSSIRPSHLRPSIFPTATITLRRS